MANYRVISANEVHEKVLTGSALLVCAYDSDEKFEKFHLQGAISLSEFQQKVGSLSKDTELIFY